MLLSPHFRLFLQPRELGELYLPVAYAGHCHFGTGHSRSRVRQNVQVPHLQQSTYVLHVPRQLFVLPARRGQAHGFALLGALYQRQCQLYKQVNHLSLYRSHESNNAFVQGEKVREGERQLRNLLRQSDPEQQSSILSAALPKRRNPFAVQLH